MGIISNISAKYTVITRIEQVQRDKRLIFFNITSSNIYYYYTYFGKVKTMPMALPILITER